MPDAIGSKTIISDGFWHALNNKTSSSSDFSNAFVADNEDSSGVASKVFEWGAESSTPGREYSMLTTESGGSSHWCSDLHKMLPQIINRERDLVPNENKN